MKWHKYVFHEKIEMRRSCEVSGEKIAPLPGVKFKFLQQDRGKAWSDFSDTMGALEMFPGQQMLEFKGVKSTVQK